MLSLFLQFELGKILKYLRTKTLAKTIIALLFITVFLFVGVGIYFFFVSGFRYINFEAAFDIRSAITLFLYEVFFLVLLGVVVMSAAVSGLFTLFRGNANSWIMSSPGYQLFPKVIFLRGLISSSLLFLVMFLPAILAFNKVYGLGLLSFVSLSLSSVLFLVIVNASTLMFIVILGFVYYILSKKLKQIRFTFQGLIVLLSTIFLLFFVATWKAMRSVDLIKLFKADEVTDVLSVSGIGQHFTLLPTHPFAMEILGWQTGNTSEALYYLLVLFLLASVLFLLWWKVSQLFYPLWLRFQEGSSFGVSKNTLHHEVYTFSGDTVTALFKKEMLISLRNFKGVLWFFFLIGLWFAQIAINLISHNTIRTYQPDLTEKIINLQVLQFIIAVYFVCAFTLRFVFPSFSVEKKTSWILSSSPLSFKNIFYGKYFFYTSFFVILGVLMGTINTLVLKVPIIYALYSIILLIATIIFIVTFGLAFGALFPNKETDDPEAISTSMSGLFFTTFSLLYGAISASALYFTLINRSVVCLFLFATMSIVLSFFIMKKVPSVVAKKKISF